VQLDSNRIVIRERDYPDVLDLALRVIRVHGWPLAAAFVAGVAPAMCLNAWLLADYTEPDFTLGFPSNYLWYMLLLVVWQMPLATAPVTLYLGEALFTDRPHPRQIARLLAGSLPQMFFYQVLLRGLLILPLVTWLLLFASAPYLNEVILLERNPMRQRRSGRMTTWRRRKALHGNFTGELFGRWIWSLCIGGLMFVSFWLSIWILGGLLSNEWGWDGSVYTIGFPLALWLTIGFFTVVRFLAYLDLRIRAEGWEIELLVRAEQTRLTRQLT